MSWPQNKDQKVRDQFRFSFQPSYQQNQISNPNLPVKATSNPIQPSVNLVAPIPKPQASKLAAKTQQQQRQKQNNRPANYNQFYQTMRLYSQDIPQQEFVPYQKTVKFYQNTKNFFDFLFLGYVVTVLYNVQKKWYKLTSRGSTTILSILGLLLVPNKIYQSKMDRYNYNFYKNNKLLLDSLLTKQDKQEIKLTDLIEKYQ